MAELDARSLVTVAVGGGAGTLARHLLVTAGGAHGAAVTLAVNAAGAFLLGLLLERLTRARLAHARRRRLLLLLARSEERRVGQERDYLLPSSWHAYSS